MAGQGRAVQGSYTGRTGLIGELINGQDRKGSRRTLRRTRQGSTGLLGLGGFLEGRARRRALGWL